MNYIKKHVKVTVRFCAISWQMSLEYFKDFLLMLLDFIATTLLTVVFWRSILGGFSQIAGWTFQDLVALGIFGSCTFAIGEFFAGSWQLADKIADGGMDKYLCRPVNALLAMVLEGVQLDEVVKGVLSYIIFLIVYFLAFSLPVDIAGIVLGFISMCIGAAVVAMLRTSISLLSLWVGNSSALQMFAHVENFSLERYPLQIMSKGMQWVFITFLPFGLIAGFPAMIFLNRFADRWLLLLIESLVLLGWSGVVWLLWKRGLKRYEAVGG